MRKIEKPTIKHKNVVEEANKAPVKQEADSPYGVLEEVFPKCAGKLKYAYEEEVLKDDYKPLGTYYVEDSFGRMYFRTNSRAKAQEMADYCYPPAGKYRVRVEMKANIR